MFLIAKSRIYYHAFTSIFQQAALAILLEVHQAVASALRYTLQFNLHLHYLDCRFVADVQVKLLPLPFHSCLDLQPNDARHAALLGFKDFILKVLYAKNFMIIASICSL